MPLIKLNATQGLTGTLPAVSGANLTNIDGGSFVKLLSTTVSSSTASVSFNSTYITSTYDIYKLIVTNAIPVSDAKDFQVGLSTDNLSNVANIDQRSSGSRFIINDGNTQVTSTADFDQVGVDYVHCSDDVGSATGESFNAEFTFYQLSGSSYKYFTMVGSNGHSNDYSGLYLVGSQIKTTSAVNGILVKFQASNIASGVFTLYGVSN